MESTVKEGKKGNRQLCIEAARMALAQRSNVIITHVNFDAAQRADFLSLAEQMEVQVQSLLARF